MTKQKLIERLQLGAALGTVTLNQEEAAAAAHALQTEVESLRFFSALLTQLGGELHISKAATLAAPADGAIEWRDDHESGDRIYRLHKKAG